MKLEDFLFLIQDEEARMKLKLIMKKIILLALTALMMIGCDYQNPDGSFDTSKSLTMETIVIDSCEYISGYYKLAHKGNCKFCAERRKMELEELVIKLKEN